MCTRRRRRVSSSSSYGFGKRVNQRVRNPVPFSFVLSLSVLVIIDNFIYQIVGNMGQRTNEVIRECEWNEILCFTNKSVFQQQNNCFSTS